MFYDIQKYWQDNGMYANVLCEISMHVFKMYFPDIQLQVWNEDIFLFLYFKSKKLCKQFLLFYICSPGSILHSTFSIYFYEYKHVYMFHCYA